MEPNESLEDARAAKGLRIRDLADATGMSEAGVFKCLKNNQPPVNPLVREAFLKALGIKED